MKIQAYIAILTELQILQLNKMIIVHIIYDNITKFIFHNMFFEIMRF